MKTFFLVLLALVGAAAAALAIGAFRWRRGTADLVTRLTDAARPVPAAAVDPAELAGLPDPVERYLGLVLPPGHRPIRTARLAQAGEFLARPTPDGWRPFTAVQTVTTLPPGFVWDARIRMAPGVAVAVRDGFVDGTGSMRASLAGLVSLAAVEGTPDVAAGALHRYLAEAVWVPSGLLPSGGVRWSAVNDSTALATLTAGGTTVSLEFRFGQDGLVQSVYTPERMRDVDGAGVPTPWEGRFADYAERDGIVIPLRGEVEWHLPEGPQLYWRGWIVEVEWE